MNWRIKGIAQKVLSSIPGGQSLNDRLQQRLGAMSDFSGHVRGKVKDDWCVFATYLRDANPPVPFAGCRLFEVGTGWLPTLPVCFHLTGAAQVVTFDLNRHLNASLSFRMLDELEQYLPFLNECSRVSEREIEARYRRLKDSASVDDLLQRAGIDYHAPADAAETGLPGESFDAVFSNSVFEHVPAPAIERILAESRRILKPGGMSMHSVNCGDHYAYFDGTISPVNYLQFTEDQWRLWNNSLLYQNRLRPADFLRMAEEAGLELAFSKYQPNEKALKSLHALALAPEFRVYRDDDLTATSVDFLGRKPCSEAAAAGSSKVAPAPPASAE